MALELTFGKSSGEKTVNCPKKTGINLVNKGNKAQRTPTSYGLSVVLIVVLLICIVKFGVVDQLARASEAENEYYNIHTTYETYEAVVSTYDEVKAKYMTSALDWLGDENDPNYVAVDRLDILDMVENKMMNYGSLLYLRISDTSMTVTMTDMELEGVSQMLEELNQEPIVANAVLDLAQNQGTEEYTKVEYSITITLQVPVTEEAAQ